MQRARLFPQLLRELRRDHVDLLDRGRPAFAIKACATLPFRCASRPESSANVSKIPYLDGPILIANQDTVFGSASTNPCPACKNFSTSASLPGLASSTTHNAFPFITSSSFSNFPSHSAAHLSTTNRATEKAKRYADIPLNEATVVPCSPARKQRLRRQRNCPTIPSGLFCPECLRHCGDN